MLKVNRLYGYREDMFKTYCSLKCDKLAFLEGGGVSPEMQFVCFIEDFKRATVPLRNLVESVTFDCHDLVD